MRMIVIVQADTNPLKVETLNDDGSVAAAWDVTREQGAVKYEVGVGGFRITAQEAPAEAEPAA